MKVIKPPTVLDHDMTSPILFLGGSIEQGTAKPWQDEITAMLADNKGTILNPRRDAWDSSWEQDPTPGTQFHGQVTWELDGQIYADCLVYYFDPNTKSPVTLLELGLFGESHTFVYCSKDFWRYGNVKIVCERFGINIHEDETSFLAALKAYLEALPLIWRG